MNTTQNQISLMSLFEVGTHRGNRRSRLNPRLKTRIYGVSKGLCLINLVETNNSIVKAQDLIYKLGQKKKQVLVVGTSKHIAPLTVQFANTFADKMPYVNNRWLGGLLTNWSTIKRTLKTQEKLEHVIENKEFFNKLARNEQLRIEREYIKLNKTFGGLTNLKTNKPGAILVLDAASDPVAIKEADSLGIPVITLANTSTVTLPKNLDYAITANVNSIKAVEQIITHLIESYNAGLTAGAIVTEEKQEKK